MFRHAQEKTLCLAGDTIWNGYVEENLKKQVQDIITLNCGNVQALGLGSIIMNKEDVSKIHQAAPAASS